MAKVKLTAGRIAGFKCDDNKTQDFLWCDEVQGLGVRATPNSTAKSYIYQAKVNRQSMRVTIGKVDKWSIEQAKAEARRLQILIDNGDDPREVKSSQVAAKIAANLAKEVEAAALLERQATEAVTAGEAWQAYVAERSASIIDGKPEWGEKHRLQHAYFVQAGGVKRTRGRRPNEPDTTRSGILVPLMAMRLIDLDANAIGTWLDQEAAQAPAAAALAFRHLRAFLTWCAKHDHYKATTHTDACKSDEVKRKVPTPKTKKNESLRRAQI